LNRRLLVVLLAAVAVTGAAFAVFACGDKTDKTTSASAAAMTASGTCTAANAAKCPYHNSSASNAAVTASASGSCSHGASASNAAVTASASGSCSHGASAARSSGVSAVAAGMGGSCSSAKNSAAAASGACTAHGMMTTGVGSCARHKGAAVTFEAMSAGSGACGGKGIGASAMATNMAHDCDACSDMAACEAVLKSAGSNFQVVPLKNGVMYVYTAEDSKNIRAVQSAIAHRTERINALVSADNAKLCSDCKQMRGAMASGKLTREIVNIEGGSISLVTSSDPAMVARLYAMAGLSTQKLVKS
jgi:hypothetical protein